MTLDVGLNVRHAIRLSKPQQVLEGYVALRQLSQLQQ